jgi:Bifunctional DNA primase/polymerase, N-terminal
MTGCLHFDDGDPVCARLGLGAAALRYAALGYRVLPLRRGGKEPHRMLPDAPDGKGGVHWATDNAWDIDSWWRKDPGANIGIATGGGLVVLDCDVKNGKDGITALAQMMRAYGLEFPPDVVTMVTPSGGLHYWLAELNRPVPQRLDIGGMGVDIKSDGGYVAAPPSMTLKAPLARPGERVTPVPMPYMLTSGCICSVPQAPSWVADWASWSSDGGGTGDGSGSADGDLPSLAELQKNGIPAGRRNKTLYRLACSRMRVHGTTPAGVAAVLDELATVWQAGDTTGMTYHELRVITESARRFVASQQERELAMARAWIEGNRG